MVDLHQVAMALTLPVETPNFVNEIWKYGFGAPFILYLIWINRQKDNHYTSLREAHDALMARYIKDISDCFERRIVQGIDNTKLLAEASQIMARLGTVTERHSDILTVIVSSLARIDGALMSDRGKK